MASRTINEAFSAISDLKLWFNNRSGANLKISDIPSLIPLRWAFFRDQWEFIKGPILDNASQYTFPDLLRDQVQDLTNFIDRQKNSQNKNVNPFSNKSIFTKFYAVWDNIDVSSIALTRKEQILIEERVRKISRFIRTDFENLRTSITAARDEVADTVGLSDPDYNLITGRSSTSTLRTVKISDIVQMQIFQSTITSINYILANSNRLNTINVDPFALARQNANNPDINIVTGRSVRLVRMFFGDNLQSLAHRHLGDPDRWMEIAIANDLKAPYIDEIGEAISLLSNGEDNKVNISPIALDGSRNIDKFYINQPVFLQSTAVKFPEQRIIQNIIEVPISGEIILELSGDSDLDKMKITENANIRIYKRNTINSNFFVAIPSPSLPSGVQVGETPFFLESKSEDEKRAGVDLLTDNNGDLVFGSNGDLQLSFGIANALQALKFKMLSERGQSKRHPGFGLPVVVGEKERDPDTIRQTLVDGINDLIAADPRFDRIEQIELVKGDKNDMRIGLVVRLAGTGTLLPLSFKLNVN